ncbi:MAG: hypothetical protein QOF37_742 [Thermoleophilaceae bacterium]|jgi:hypothetical protein|nr:hypothetical protein [Thermoleophilaceae bacterium]
MRERLSKTAVIRILGAAALALTALLAVAGTASAGRSQPTMLQDDKVLIGGSQQQRDARLDELKGLGVDIVKVRLSWRYIAPGGTSRTKPSFNATDPNAYPASAWAPYDAVVRGAAARGMGVFFQLGGSAPEWATGGSRNSSVNEPNANEFKSFVQAVGTRYSGSFGGSAGGGTPGGLPIPVAGLLGSGAGATSAASALPRVTAYSVWNEPNLKSWLSPQVKNGVPYAPVLYRRLMYAAADGLSASGHGSDQLLLGELLPFARSGRTGTTKIRPVAFLRELGCVDSHYRPYRGKAAKLRGCTGKFRKVPGTGVAFHPYTLGGGPNVPTPNRDDASISTLSRVTGAVDRLFSKHRIAKRRMPLWITEFGFQSNPPDRYATPLGKIPGFMGQSERIAYKNSRVLSYSQYPLLDDPALGGFQSGLRFKNNKPKGGVYNAFAHTIYVRRISGSRVEVFGCERAASSGAATIQARTGAKGKWKTVASAAVNQLGYFDRTVKLSSASKRQYRYVMGNAKSRVAGAAKR